MNIGYRYYQAGSSHVDYDQIFKRIVQNVETMLRQVSRIFSIAENMAAFIPPVAALVLGAGIDWIHLEEVVWMNLNPVYQETLDLDLTGGPNEDSCKLLVELYDR